MMDLEAQTELLRTGFSLGSLNIWLAANCRCEYCDEDLLRNGAVYTRGYQLDHIVPTRKGGGIEPENLALSCSPCNLMKRGWDPREPNVSLSRSDLIKRVRDYLSQKRSTADESLRRHIPLLVRCGLPADRIRR